MKKLLLGLAFCTSLTIQAVKIKRAWPEIFSNIMYRADFNPYEKQRCLIGWDLNDEFNPLSIIE